MGLSFGSRLMKTTMMLKTKRSGRANLAIATALVSSMVGMKWLLSFRVKPPVNDPGSCKRNVKSETVREMKLPVDNRGETEIDSGVDSDTSIASMEYVSSGLELTQFHMEHSKEEVECSVYSETGFKPSVSSKDNFT
eukprot:g3451.t1